MFTFLSTPYYHYTDYVYLFLNYVKTICNVRSLFQYLYENEDKVYIDVNDMADYLQRKYRDYRGKKRGPFRSMVRRAYDEITENVARRSDPRWPDDDDEIDVEVCFQTIAAITLNINR